ncbi:MAG TPA: UDP-N-acetylmuramoyl-L-alanine--D-glutamate ligase [Candidatus Saccharimonadales bacterium]|nr:UDP-N-acetylmuramoyl-L-alanine--D-glutamate ligase [Candidatus Saccharimonadales bacterium]
MGSKKVAIVGYGIEGRSALRYWQEHGADVTVCDQNAAIALPKGVESQLGPDYLKNLERFDIIMRTAGMHPKIILAANPGVEKKITTTVNEFLRVCPTPNTIGVTGTKGKGTTSTLIQKMLEAAGKKVFLGGNYGVSPFDFLPKITKDSWVVLELSSFMLYDITRSPHIGVCLMIQPEHLDWHGDVRDYYWSKRNMFAFQKDTDVAIYYAESLRSHDIARASPGDKIAYYDEPGAYIYKDNIMIDQTVLCKTGELQLMGQHNWQNICAAATTAWQVVQAPDAFRKALLAFTGLPHRLEFVREVSGIKFYNDSFASDPYATNAAIGAVPGNKVIIIGGYERMLPLDTLTATVLQHRKTIRGLLLIGASAERVAAELNGAKLKNYTITTAKTMPDIVEQATKMAKKGDSVVLSPGFASFDMFKNFEERGLAFKEAVHAL